ncbi:TPA: cytochrome, partial [Neisseria gonorrhoeae]
MNNKVSNIKETPMNTTRLPTALVLHFLCAAASAADNSIMTKGQKVYES